MKTTRYSIQDLTGRRALLVASTGGHLTQLARLERHLGVDPDSRWMTFDTPQSRSLLEGRDVVYLPYVAPRDLQGILRSTRMARPWLDGMEACVSTGAGVALAVLPEMALRRRMPSIYIESVSRVQGPSTTGRLLRRVPAIGLYCQHDTWCARPWRLGPSVLADYEPSPRASHGVSHVLVTLGTIRPYRFDRLVNAALRALRIHAPHADVTWQVGCTTRDDLPGTVVDQLDDAEFGHMVDRADLVFAHAGVGVALRILDHGKIPLLMSRDPSRREHVDGHQRQILDYLVQRNLAVDLDAAAIGTGLQMALTTQVTRHVPERSHEVA